MYLFRAIIKLEKEIVEHTVQDAVLKLKKNKQNNKSQLQSRRYILNNMNRGIERYDVASKMAHLSKKQNQAKVRSEHEKL